MVRTPEEIKKGLECCSNATVESCGECPYHTKEDHSAVCIVHLTKDAKVLLAQVERERDSALKEWKRTKMDSEGMCWTCKHGCITGIGSCRCVSPYPCDEGEEWEWRGVFAENSKEDEENAD